MLNAIFEMKFSFVWLHLFPCESKGSRRLIVWACFDTHLILKYLSAFDALLKSQRGTKGAPAPLV